MHLPFFAVPGQMPGKQQRATACHSGALMDCFRPAGLSVAFAHCGIEERGTEAVRRRSASPKDLSAADRLATRFRAAAKHGARTFEYNRQTQGQVQKMINMVQTAK